MNPPQKRASWRTRTNEVIFGADTPAGKAFDLVLIVAIISSLAVVMLDSVKSVNAEYGPQLRFAEWTFTLLFSIEYAVRLSCVDRPAKYARSFFGIVDLLAILPTYVSLFVPGAQALLVIRTLRILRVFRVLELGSYVSESEQLARALSASKRKIQVFVFTVLILVVIFGSLMYLIEGPEGGFTSIPRGVYWAIVTMTTVGYGDIAPASNLGQAIAACIMILGYGIIAVPTGIVSAELTLGDRRRAKANAPSMGKACAGCGADGHAPDASFCRICGARL
jgi:voltage-gated potassium channel